MGRIVKTLVFALVLGVFAFLPSQSQAKTKITTPTGVRVRSNKSKRLKVKWNKVKKADGYQIYEYKKSKKTFKRVADVGSKIKSWKSRNTKKEHIYKVRAYRKIRKKRVYSKFSYPVRAIPYKKNAKRVNAGRLWFQEDLLDMSVHQCLTPTLKVKASRYAKNNKAQVYDSTIRWSSSDETIAKVDENGAITTQGKEGSCKIYARAHNGNVTWIKVYAEDYARNVKFENVQGMLDDMQDLINNYQTEIEGIAAYFEKNQANHPKEDQQMTFTLNEERTKVIGQVTSGSKIKYGDIENTMLRVLQSFPGNMQIIVIDGVIRFRLWSGSRYVELNYIFHQLVHYEENIYHFTTADRWIYHYTGPIGD